MNNQDQLNHLQELIQFLEIQNKGLSHWAKHRNTAWLTTTIDRLKAHAHSTVGVEPLKSTIAFQNEFRSFLTTWLKRVQVNTSKQTNAGLDNEVHNQQKIIAGVYLRQLIRVHKELIEALDNKPQKEN